jgi:GT2 family glycosyltransferase
MSAEVKRKPAEVWLPLPAETELVVIVLQWGKSEETLKCLSALRLSRGVRFTTVVVDNGSPEPGAVDRVRAACPWVHIVENGSNLGFAEGNNVVLRGLVARRQSGAGPRWAMLLNNDVELEPDCLARMMATAEGKNAGAIGALNFRRGTSVLGSSGGFVDWPGGTYRDAGAEALACGEPLAVQTLAGSTLLLDLEALRQVGLLDAEYFCVYEETDLCLRLLTKGYGLWLDPAARAQHAVGASTPRPLHLYFRFRNRIEFVRRHGGRGALRGLMPRLVCELGWRLPAYCLLGRLGQVTAIVRGLRDGWRRRLGPGPLLAGRTVL